MGKRKSTSSRDGNKANEKNNVELKLYYSLAFALIIVACIIQLVPRFSKTSWYGIAGWICLYVASCIVAWYSRMLGNRYGVYNIVLGSAAISISFLLGMVEEKGWFSEFLIILERI